MNLETLSSPGGEVSGASCSLSSLLALSCRSRAEAAHSFAKKLQTKLWSLGPNPSSSSTSDELSTAKEPANSGDEDDSGSWGLTLETRFDLKNKRTETVVTSVPRIAPNRMNLTSNVRWQALEQHPQQTSVSLQDSTEQPAQSEDMENHKGKHGNIHLGTWMASSKPFAGNGAPSATATQQRQTDEFGSSGSLNPMSDSDQYFDFGIESPQDGDSAGEESTCHKQLIVINQDDGLPVQPESGCIFGSPILSSDDSEEDREEDASVYESLSQSPASAGFLQKDRFFLMAACDSEQVLDSSAVNTDDDDCTGIVGHERIAARGAAQVMAAKALNNINDEAHAQSETGTQCCTIPLPRDRLTRVVRDLQGGLEDTGDSSDEGGRSRCTLPAGEASESLSESEREETVRCSPACCENGKRVSKSDFQLEAVQLSPDMVRLDPIEQLFGENDNVEIDNDVRDVDNVSSLLSRFDLEKDTSIDGYSSLHEGETVDGSATTPLDESSQNESDSTSTSSSSDSSSSETSRESSPAVEETKVVVVHIEKPECIEGDDDADVDDADDQPNRHRVQRSTSLKSGKTPPGTPGRKKIVRFADALGLDLALVRTFLDEVPNVPQSAFSDLNGVVDDDPVDIGFQITPQGASYLRVTNRGSVPLVQQSRTLVSTFAQPGNLPDFLERVKRQKICLETAVLVDDSRLRGVVRVLNLDYHKSVLIRYTLDEWKTQFDMIATYVPGSCDGLSDRFSFSLACAQCLQPGQRLIFALCYRVGGQEIWDNNMGKNYVFQCISSSNYMPSIALSPPNVETIQHESFLPYM